MPSLFSIGWATAVIVGTGVDEGVAVGAAVTDCRVEGLVGNSRDGEVAVTVATAAGGSFNRGVQAPRTTRPLHMETVASLCNTLAQ